MRGSNLDMYIDGLSGLVGAANHSSSVSPAILMLSGLWGVILVPTHPALTTLTLPLILQEKESIIIH